MSFKTLLVIIFVLMIIGGTFLFWYWLFGLNKNAEETSVIPPQAELPQTETIKWEAFEDLNDGYSLEYPVGPAWQEPIYVGSGEMRSIGIASKGEHTTHYFTMFIQSSSSAESELQEMIAVYSRTFGVLTPEPTILKGQEAARIAVMGGAHYLFARNNAVWIMYEPHFSDLRDKEIAERIFDSLNFLPVQEN